MKSQILDMVGNRGIAELIRMKNEEDTASKEITSTEDPEPLRALSEQLKEVNQDDGDAQSTNSTTTAATTTTTTTTTTTATTTTTTSTTTTTTISTTTTATTTTTVPYYNVQSTTVPCKKMKKGKTLAQHITDQRLRAKVYLQNKHIGHAKKKDWYEDLVYVRNIFGLLIAQFNPICFESRLGNWKHQMVRNWITYMWETMMPKDLAMFIETK